MRKLYPKFLPLVLICILTYPAKSFAQASACPSVNAGTDQVICQGQCANLNATIQGTLATSTYTVNNVAYNPYPYNVGTTVLLGVDDQYTNIVNLPFCFEFFGNSYNQIVIGANGVITFNTGYANTGSGYTLCGAIPTTCGVTPLNSIMAPYHDIDPSIGGTIKYATYGSSPCREFVVSWYQIPLYSFACNGMLQTQQVVLHEATNIIDIYIQNKNICSGWIGGVAIEGIQNATGTVGFAVPGRNNTQWACTNDGKRFMPNGAQNYTIQWFDPSMTLITNTAATSVCPTVSGNYTAILTNTTCAGPIVVQDQVNVTVSPITVTAGNGGPYCPGQTINLTATAGGTDYDWVGPGGYVQNNTQNPNIPGATLAMGGVYTVTMTNGAGCTTTSTTTVVVGGTGATANNTGPYCAGTTINLTSGAGGLDYDWIGPAGYNQPNTQNPNIAASTVGMSGVYTVTVTYAGGCTATATTSVTVNPMPAPTANNTGPYCAGATIQLNSPAGSATDDWTGPGGYMQNNTQNPTILASTVAMSGVYTVTVTAAGGCSATATTSVTVNPVPAPTANNTGPYCEGSTIQLNSPTGSATDDWTGPGGYIQNDTQNPTILNSTVAMGGVYTVTVTNGSGCSATTTTTVVVNATPVPTANNTGSYCPGQTIQLNSPTGSATDDWTGPGGYVQNNMQNPTIASASAANAGVYTVTVTNGFGCSATATTTVVVNSGAVAIANNTGPYCAGASIDLSSPAGPIDWDWTGPGGYVQNNTQNPSIPASTVAMSGVYTVTITMAGGCTGTGTTTVTVNPLPAPTANNTGPYCEGASIQLNSPIGFATDDWTGPIAYVQNDIQNPTIAVSTVAMNGVYTVSVTDGNGCNATATTTVIVNALPAAIANNNSPVCELQNVNLNSGGGIDYDWIGPGGYNVANTQNPTIVAASAADVGVYTVTVTDANGCVSTATTTILVNSNLVFNAGSNSPICSGSTLNLTADNIPGATYNWAGPNAFVALNTQNPTIPGAINTAAGIYTVLATSAAGCTGTATVTAVINEIPTPLFAGDVLSGCAPVCVNFTDQSVVVGSAISSWSWNVESQVTSNTQNVNFCFLNPGLYDATLTVTSAAGCSATLTLIDYIDVGTSPVADFIYAPQEISILEPDVNFGNTSAGATVYGWDFGDGTTSVQTNPIHTYADTGVYCVSLIAANVYGCTDTAVHCLHIKPEYTLFVPNSFTVNDDGLNEIWTVHGLNIKSITVRIFDRWGEEIFSFDDINKGWPGTKQNGQECKQDVYVYRIELIDGNDDFHELVGQVNLIR